MKLESIRLGEISQRKMNTTWSHSQRNLKTSKQKQTDLSSLIPRPGWCLPEVGSWGVGEIGERGQKVYTSVIKWTRHGDAIYSMVTTVNSQSVQLLSHVQLFATPWTAARQASLSITNSQGLLKLMFTESAMPSNHLILYHPLLLLP